MKKIFRLLLVVLVGVVGGMSAQGAIPRPERVKVFNPVKNYMHSKILYKKDADRLLKSKSWGQETDPTGRIWTAYSDREENVTYSEPNMKSTPYDKLKFNEAVRIADIKDNFALVYTEPKIATPYPQLSNEAKVRGWIPMDALLLWAECPTNDKGIYNKALLALNLQEDVDENLGSYYLRPDSKKESGKVATTMDFYYIMKEDPTTNRYLLSKSNSLDGSSYMQLYGWVGKNSFIEWNQRSCLEPTWNKEDVKHFKSVSKTYPVYRDLKSKEPGSYYTYGKTNKHDQNPDTRHRMDPYTTRYPILDNTTNNNDYYRCTVFGGHGRIINSEEQEQEVAEAKRKMSELQERLKNINLIFVIDGTRSMKQNFAAVKQAIKDGLEYFDKQRYKPRIGVVIYRDHADGDAMIEYLPLVSYNDPRLTKFLDNVGNLGYGAESAPEDHDLTEALFLGISKALDNKTMGYTADQGNIMMVVGDCGNPAEDKTSPSQEELVKKMVDLNMNLLSYQVRNSISNEAWSLFDMQLSDILKKNMVRQYKRLKMKNEIKVSFEKSGDGYGYDLKNNLESDCFVGAKRAPIEDDKNMDPAILAKLITQNIQTFAQAIQHQIDIYNKRGDGKVPNMQLVNDSSKVISDMTLDDSFLRMKLGEKLYDALASQAATFTFTGFVPKEDASNRKFWGPVVFLSSSEFESLMGRLRPVYEAAQKTDRKTYINAVKGLLKALVPDASDEMMDKMGMDYVMQLLAGLNESTQTMKTYSLVQIADENVVDQTEYRGMINDFQRKYRRLDEIMKHPYAYSFVTGGMKYYWIPLEDLP